MTSRDIHHLTWAHQPEETFLFLPFKLLYAVACHLSALQMSHRCFGRLLWHAGDRKRSSTLFQVILSHLCVWMLPVRNQFSCLCVKSLSAMVENNVSARFPALFPQTKHMSCLFTPQSVSQRARHSYTAVMLLKHWCQMEYAIHKKESRCNELAFFTLTQSRMIHMDVNVWTRLWALSKSMPKWLPVIPELSACCFMYECSFCFLFFLLYLMWHKK